MATTPGFAATPRRSSILVNTANVNTDGTGGGSFPTVFTAGANGSRVDSVKIKSIIAEAAVGVTDSVRLWLYDGATKILLAEQLVTAFTPDGKTIASFEALLPMGFDLPPGNSLLASTHTGGVNASYHVTGFGGDY